MGKVKVGIAGCTGIVGQEFVRLLFDHPYFEIVALSASSRSSGKTYGESLVCTRERKIPASIMNEIVYETSPRLFLEKDAKIIFSALPSQVAKSLELEMAEMGLSVFSNSSAHRLESQVPILIPEINPEHLNLILAQISKRKGFILTGPNCSVSGLALVLKPLMDLGLKSVIVTTYQAVSGAGRRGVASLDILGNIIPYIENEEEKIEKETKKVLGKLRDDFVEEAKFEINSSCCRVPVADGHLESVVMEFDEDTEPELIKERLNSFQGIPQQLKLPSAPQKPIIVKTETTRPQPVLDAQAGFPEVARGMAVTVGRIRKKGKRINLFLLVHNTIRGAAGTCILNAELALAKRFLNQ